MPTRVPRLRIASVLLGVVVGTLATTQLNAAPITLSLVQPDLTTASDEVIFRGTVRNETGGSLDTADLFLNFFDFDPAFFLSLEQLIGVPSFAILDGETSPVIDIFKAVVDTLASHSQPMTLSIVLQDVADNVSDPSQASVTIESVPEPGMTVLVLYGLALAARARRLAKRETLTPTIERSQRHG
jgi:hypothetical protein